MIQKLLSLWRARYERILVPEKRVYGYFGKSQSLYRTLRRGANDRLYLDKRPIVNNRISLKAKGRA